MGVSEHRSTNSATTWACSRGGAVVAAMAACFLAVASEGRSVGVGLIAAAVVGAPNIARAENRSVSAEDAHGLTYGGRLMVGEFNGGSLAAGFDFSAGWAFRRYFAVGLEVQRVGADNGSDYCGDGGRCLQSSTAYMTYVEGRLPSRYVVAWARFGAGVGVTDPGSLDVQPQPRGYVKPAAALSLGVGFGVDAISIGPSLTVTSVPVGSRVEKATLVGLQISWLHNATDL